LLLVTSGCADLITNTKNTEDISSESISTAKISIDNAISSTTESENSASKTTETKSTISSSITNDKSISTAIKSSDDITSSSTNSANIALDVTGNSIGNIANEGLVAYMDSYIFFTLIENQDRGKLCKAKVGDSKYSVINYDFSRYINAYNGFIYYCDTKDDPEIFGPAEMYGPIIRIDSNGKNRKTITSDYAGYLTIVNDYIYYINASDGNKVYRMKIDGTQEQKISDDKTYNMCVYKGYVYFTANERIYRVNPDKGGTKKMLLNDTVMNFILYNDKIYYVDDYVGEIYKMDIDGKNRKMICNEKVDYSFNIYKDSLYYEISEPYFEDYTKAVIIKRSLDKDSKDRAKLSDGDMGCIVQGWMYFYRDEGEGTCSLHMMKLDGSNEKLIE